MWVSKQEKVHCVYFNQMPAFTLQPVVSLCVGNRHAPREMASSELIDLTPSLPQHHLKTTNKSVKFETLKPFCLLFRTGT